MIIETQQQLNSICEKVSEYKIIACDTEFIRNHTVYTPKLCLFQIATPNEEIFLIDTLQNLDFSPLIAILTNESILKVFHSIEQDTEVVLKNFNVKIDNIFDTQQALFFLGHETQCSYAKAIKSYLGIDLEKDNQYSDWANRPLSAAQIEYARNDVKYLLELYNYIKGKLKSRYFWALEESQQCHYEEDEILMYYNYLKSSFNHFIAEKPLKNAIKIFMWREEEAQKKNIHPKGIVSNEKIQIFLRKGYVRDQAVNSKLNKVIESFESPKEQEILECYFKKKEKSDMVNKQLMQLCIMISMYLAKKHSLPSSLLVNKCDLASFLWDEKSKIDTGWRKNIFKNYLSLLKNGKLLVGMKKGEIFIQNIANEESSIT